MWGTQELFVLDADIPPAEQIVEEMELVAAPTIQSLDTPETRTLTGLVKQHVFYRPILEDSETVTIGETKYTRDTDYAMDYLYGGITRIATGILPDPATITIDYKYINKGPSTVLMGGGRKRAVWTLRCYCTKSDMEQLEVDYLACYKRTLSLEDGQNMIAQIKSIASAQRKQGSPLIWYTISFIEA